MKLSTCKLAFNALLASVLFSSLSYISPVSAENYSYLPGGDPLMMGAQDDCSNKAVKKAIKSAKKYCKKAGKTALKINKEEKKITKEQDKLVKTIEKNNKKMELQVQKKHDSCQKQKNNIYQQMAKNALLKQQTQHAIVNCIGGFFGFGGGCSDKDQKLLLKLIDQESKLLLKLEAVDDKCAVQKEQIKQKYSEKNNNYAYKTEDKISSTVYKIEEYEFEIADNLSLVVDANEFLLSCGANPVNC